MISFINHRTISTGLNTRRSNILSQTDFGKHSLYYKAIKVLKILLLLCGITLKINRMQEYYSESNLTDLNRDIFKLIRFL